MLLFISNSTSKPYWQIEKYVTLEQLDQKPLKNSSNSEESQTTTLDIPANND